MIENERIDIGNTEGQTESELDSMLNHFYEEQKLLHSNNKKLKNSIN